MAKTCTGCLVTGPFKNKSYYYKGWKELILCDQCFRLRESRSVLEAIIGKGRLLRRSGGWREIIKGCADLRRKCPADYLILFNVLASQGIPYEEVLLRATRILTHLEKPYVRKTTGEAAVRRRFRDHYFT